MKAKILNYMSFWTSIGGLYKTDYNLIVFLVESQLLYSLSAKGTESAESTENVQKVQKVQQSKKVQKVQRVQKYQRYRKYS